MKYFITSDIHGDFYALKNGLEEAGYEPNNPEHQIIDLGDMFGRSQTYPAGSKDCFNYMMSGSHTNKPICIYGNHYAILENIFNNNEWDWVDYYNGEVATLGSFVGLTQEEMIYQPTMTIYPAKKALAKWIASLPFYYETKNYIFVHGWLPELHGKIRNLTNKKIGRQSWIGATWCKTKEKIADFEVNYPQGYNKTIVFGHWGTWDLREIWPDENQGNDIWVNKKLKLIGMDQTTYHSHKYKVLIINDEPLSLVK